MQSDLNIAGIRRTGRAGRYRYSVIDNGGSSADRPITYVSWFDAARFANWMANGQPIGRQSPATTEDGAYTLRRHGITAPARNSINPNTGKAASFFIPTENEWYKAAYFNPTLNNSSGGYTLYATQSNSAPSNSPSTGGSNEANLANGFVFYNTQSTVYDPITNYLSDVGQFSNSRSFYGTYDQAGLVYEWNDLSGERSREKGLRGGYWFSAGQSAMSTTFSLATPDRESSDAGFRLVAADPLLPLA
jgi:formylglycine-generating enzyme required for sulfatase activity